MEEFFKMHRIANSERVLCLGEIMLYEMKLRLVLQQTNNKIHQKNTIDKQIFNC